MWAHTSTSACQSSVIDGGGRGLWTPRPPPPLPGHSQCPSVHTVARPERARTERILLRGYKSEDQQWQGSRCSLFRFVRWGSEWVRQDPDVCSVPGQRLRRCPDTEQTSESCRMNVRLGHREQSKSLRTYLYRRDPVTISWLRFNHSLSVYTIDSSMASACFLLFSSPLYPRLHLLSVTPKLTGRFPQDCRFQIKIQPALCSWR